MNCKPGDIAIMVRCNTGRNIGAMLRVIDRGETAGWWLCEALSAVYSKGKRLPPGTLGECADASLRPLRDPGPDAVDETLRPYRLPEVA